MLNAAYVINDDSQLKVWRLEFTLSRAPRSSSIRVAWWMLDERGECSLVSSQILPANPIEYFSKPLQAMRFKVWSSEYVTHGWIIGRLAVVPDPSGRLSKSSVDLVTNSSLWTSKHHTRQGSAECLLIRIYFNWLANSIQRIAASLKVLVCQAIVRNHL